MIKMICDQPYEKGKGLRKITYRYNPETDGKLLKEMEEFLNSKQPTCFNCQNHYREGCFGGYMASACRVHGNIEAWNNPHNDCDGSKCEDYKRK